MTFTLLGDVVVSGYFTLTADRSGRKQVLIQGYLFMVFTGMAFALVGSFWILLAIAAVGVVSTTGGDFGPFRAIEE